MTAIERITSWFHGLKLPQNPLSSAKLTVPDGSVSSAELLRNLRKSNSFDRPRPKLPRVVLVALAEVVDECGDSIGEVDARERIAAMREKIRKYVAAFPSDEDAFHLISPDLMPEKVA